ncbi:cytochrome c oxidase subunit 2A [Paenibacillus sp. S-38]|uniref:cytochrome c oxidase subunit 2A n=1 Tax=Paenibacillus sp. S-38 TaxID=3416710 RepID=UPI003CF820B0
MKKEQSRPAAGPWEGEHQEPSLKGTFAAVMLLGLFLILTWAGVFTLFMGRN